MPGPEVHVIDDDRAVRDSLALLLETEGLSTATYASAEAFLEAVDAEDAAFGGCVLADVQLKGMDGLEMLRRLRARGVRAPVVLMTGRPSPDLTERALRAGARAVVDKPCTPDLLLEVLRRARGAG
jgi:two-component system response regulator FixJ